MNGALDDATTEGHLLRASTVVVVRAAAFLLFVAIAVTVGLFVGVPSLEQVRQSVNALGWAGGVAFVGLYAAFTLTPAPKNVLSVVAGLVFGFSGALMLVYLGALMGAAVAFALGRWLGREAVERYTGSRVARLDDLVRRRGLAAVIGVRLIPIIPFTAINYGAGLTAVRRRDYALGTAIGILPGTAAFVALGAFGLEFGWPAWVAIGVLGVLTLAAAIWAERGRRIRRDSAALAPETAPETET